MAPNLSLSLRGYINVNGRKRWTFGNVRFDFAYLVAVFRMGDAEMTYLSKKNGRHVSQPVIPI